jgi:hypothetical protein
MTAKILPVVFIMQILLNWSDEMSKFNTKSKMKYNRANYRRYEFNLRIDGKLNAIVERYKSDPGNNLSNLMKKLLCKYFNITLNEADDILPQYHFGSNGEHIPNDKLNKYFPLDTTKEISLNSNH